MVEPDDGWCEHHPLPGFDEAHFRAVDRAEIRVGGNEDNIQVASDLVFMAGEAAVKPCGIDGAIIGGGLDGGKDVFLPLPLRAEKSLERSRERMVPVDAVEDAPAASEGLRHAGGG